MSYNIALTPVEKMAEIVAKDTNYRPYDKSLNPFRGHPKETALEFATAYLRASSKYNKQKSDSYK
jgi:hypothetical protein